MPRWLPRALERTVVRRALRYSIVVGAVLVTVNHGDAIARGDIPVGRLLRIALTVMVPYVVSTLSTLEATASEGVGDAEGPPGRR